MGAMMLAAVGLTACGFPAAAPTPRQIEQWSSDAEFDVYLVKVTGPVVRTVSEYRADGFPQSLRSFAYTPSVRLKPGDVIGVSIYEPSGSQLFSPPPSPMLSAAPGSGTAAPPAATTLPAQVVEPDGRIAVPFAGRVAVAGKTPSQAAAEVQHSLSQQAVEPQVVVTLIQNVTNTVSVGGEVTRASLVPLSLRGERLLDVIAQAGGPKYPATEIDVRMIRGNTVSTLPLQQVLNSPADNIVVQPNDTIVLVRNPKTFVVMGATARVSQYNFETEKVSVAEAVARSGGVLETTGNIAGIYVFRNEPASLARQVFASDLNAVDTKYVRANDNRLMTESNVRVMYKFDLTQSPGYFFAQNMPIRDKDIVLVSNAPLTEMQKFFQMIRGITGVYYDLSKPITVQNN
jgi:polysaccharide export outer membrane protein